MFQPSKLYTMKLKTGVDLIEIERIRASIEQHGEKFLQRIYTPRELDICAGNIASLAARFAAKEAVAKTIGTGIGAVGFRDIEILRDENRAPVLYLHGSAQTLSTQFELKTWSLSLSHTESHAIAMVVAIGE